MGPSANSTDLTAHGAEVRSRTYFTSLLQHPRRSPRERFFPMKVAEKGALAHVMRTHEADILAEWTRAQGAGASRRDPLLEADNRRSSREFLAALVKALGGGEVGAMASQDWDDVRRILDE